MGARQFSLPQPTRAHREILMTSSIVAVFDFDHTLTDRDSMLFFLFYLQGRLKTYYHLTHLLPAFGSFFGRMLIKARGKRKRFLPIFLGNGRLKTCRLRDSSMPTNNLMITSNRQPCNVWHGTKLKGIAASW